MGLQPGATYDLTVKSAVVERTLPGILQVTVEEPSEANEGNADVTGLRFVAI